MSLETRLAPAQAPAGERPGQMVPGAHRRWPPRHPQGDDRGAGAQAPGGVLGAGHQRHGAGRHAASSGESRRVSRDEIRELKEVTRRTGEPQFGASALGRDVADDDPRWRCPASAHGLGAAVVEWARPSELCRRCA